MQFFASVSYIKPFFLILVSLCVVMFQCLSDVVLFHDLFPAIRSFLSLSLPFHRLSLSRSISPPSCSHIFLLFYFFYHIVKLTPSPSDNSLCCYFTKHSKYTSKCLYVYYCVAQAAAWQSRTKKKLTSWESCRPKTKFNLLKGKKHISRNSSTFWEIYFFAFLLRKYSEIHLHIVAQYENIEACWCPSVASKLTANSRIVLLSPKRSVTKDTTVMQQSSVENCHQAASLFSVVPLATRLQFG